MLYSRRVVVFSPGYKQCLSYRVQRCINNSVLIVSPLNANPSHTSWIGINHFGKHTQNLYCPPLPFCGVKGAGVKIARFCKVPSWKWKSSFSLQGEKDIGDPGGFGLPEELPAVIPALLYALLSCHMLTLFFPGHFTISLVGSQNWGSGSVTANNVILFKLCACVSPHVTSQCWVLRWNLGRDGLWLQISAAPWQCCQPNPGVQGQVKPCARKWNETN